MALESSIDFMDLREIESSLIQASGSNVGGFAIRQDYMSVIGDYRYKETELWKKIPTGNKLPAQSPIIQELRRTNLPSVGFVDRSNLAAGPINPPVPYDYSDPGQEVKAIVGTITCEHFAMSMAAQQGRPYGDQMSKDTDELITAMFRYLEQQLYIGSVAQNPLSFNGIITQMPATDHIFTANVTGAVPDSITDTLDDICTRSSLRSTLFRHRPNYILCSGAGARLITKEIKQQQLYHNVREISPGVQVPSVLTSYGYVDILTSPHIQDLDGGAGSDVVYYYVISMNTVEWHGVYPYGGEKTFEPQIFDLSHVINGLPTLDRRMILLYGTPYCKDRGEGIFRLDVTAPSGSTF
jgi:hypothetical protein